MVVRIRFPSRRRKRVRARSAPSSWCWTPAAMCRTASSPRPCSAPSPGFSHDDPFPHPVLRAPVMALSSQVIQPYIATIEHDGQQHLVSGRSASDGIEFVGRFWFAPEGQEKSPIPDRGALPGRTHEEVLALARRLTPTELELRYLRAL